MSDAAYDRGMAVRREVLGDDHVARADAQITEFTRDFQTLITEYAWGTIWTRPGLDRRSRSMIALTALIARGRDEELAAHISRRATQWTVSRRSQRSLAADRSLLQRAGCQQRLPHCSGGVRRHRPSGLGTHDERKAVIMRDLAPFAAVD